MRKRTKNGGRFERQVGNTIDMRTYGKVAKNQLWPGRVVFAHVPFHEDPQASKSRPAVVGQVKGHDIIVFPIYTKSAPWRIEVNRHSRRSYIDLRPVTLGIIDIIATDPEDIDPAILETLLEKLP